jgi:hypothetical protein
MLVTGPRHTLGQFLTRWLEGSVKLTDAVRRLLEQADGLDLDPLDAARVEWLRQMVTGNGWYDSGAARTFVRIVEQMRDAGDVDMALRSLVPIAHRSWWTQTRPRTRQYLVDTARAMGTPNDDPRVLAVIALADPEHAGVSVREGLAPIHVRDVDDPVAAMDAGIAAEKACDFAAAAQFLTRAAERLRQQVRLGPLTQALVHLAWAAVHTGVPLRARAVGPVCERGRMRRTSGTWPRRLRQRERDSRAIPANRNTASRVSRSALW